MLTNEKYKLESNREYVEVMQNVAKQIAYKVYHYKADNSIKLNLTEKDINDFLDTQVETSVRKLISINYDLYELSTLVTHLKAETNKAYNLSFVNKDTNCESCE